jgi:hypothetical protein
VSSAKLLAAIRTRPESMQVKLLRLLLDGMAEPPADLVDALRKLLPPGAEEPAPKTNTAEDVAALQALFGTPYGPAWHCFFSTS